MVKGIVHIDYQVCMACSVCIQACPFSYLEPARTGIGKYQRVYPQLTHDHQCTGCGLCARACPLDCLLIKSLPLAS